MEAVILRKRSGAIHYWKKYDLVENVSYTWNRWNLVSTTIYKWNKWNAVENGYTLTKDNYSGSYTAGLTGDGRYQYAKAVSTIDAYEEWDDRWGEIADGSYYERQRWYCTGASGSPVANVGSDASNYFAGDGWLPGGGSSYYAFWRQLFKLNKVTSITHGTWNGNTWTQGSATFSVSQRWYKAVSYGKGTTSYGQVTSTSSSAYPSNGVSGSYWYVSAGSEVQYSKGSTQQPDVTSADSTAYPENGHDGSYWYDNRTSNTSHSMGSYIEDIFSTDPSKYPANGISGSFWYVYQGQL